jgi:hypothetical protein
LFLFFYTTRYLAIIRNGQYETWFLLFPEYEMAVSKRPLKSFSKSINGKP